MSFNIHYIYPSDRVETCTSRATAEAGVETTSVPPGRAAKGGARTGEHRGAEEKGDWGKGLGEGKGSAG